MIPTLNAGPALSECLAALSRQSWTEFEVLVVDNSGRKLSARLGVQPGVETVFSERNIGFGAAANEGFRRRQTEFLAVLNDDATPHPEWLERLMAAAVQMPDTGMWASQIRLAGTGLLDSAGLLLYADGTSKQRGHRRPYSEYASPCQVLVPSGCAALYRRQMLEEIGLFDEAFFLYCEDTDLGLRGQWAGWRCAYVPDAVVDHQYSQTAGAASRLKARLVERNRLYLVIKNFPLRMMLGVPAAAVVRYWEHWREMRAGRGAAGQFRKAGEGGVLALAGYVMGAHFELLRRLPTLWKQRRGIRAKARLTPAGFRQLAAAHSIDAHEVAAQ